MNLELDNRGSAALVRLVQVLVMALLLCVGASAQGGEHGGAHEDGHGGPAKSTMEMESGEFFNAKFVHLMPHAKFGDGLTTFFDVNLYQIFVVIGIAVLFLLVASSFRGSGQAPWVIRVFRGWCHWIRDEVVITVMGEEEGKAWAPFFIYVFFFIAFLNLVGLVPGSVTSTACVFVTAALASVILVVMIGGGMLRQGPVAFWKNLLPHGLPAALIPLMAVVEFIGLFVKPIALTIRLFANMLAGHLLIYAFVALIFVFAKMFEMGVLSWAVAIPVVGMAVFINIIEALVVLLQAYIFTYLSVLFVQASLHPEH